MSNARAAIEAVLAESGPDFEDYRYERPSAGHQGEVFIVSLTHDDEEYEVVVKFEPPSEPDFALEPFMHDYVADRTDVPVPRILVYEDDPAADIPPYFITERVEGENLAESLSALDGDLRGRIVEQAGRILGETHAEIGFEGFGRLGLDGDRLVVRDLSWDWRETFRTLVERQIDRLAGGTFADLQSAAREHLAASVDVIPTGGVPRLVHDDFRPANMLYDRTAPAPITAVLDWQFVLAAHPEYHVARTDFLFVDPAFRDADTRRELRERLYEGYREYRDFEADEAYERRRPVYHFATLLWRMASFEAAFEDVSDLAQARAEARFRKQFEALTATLPEA